LGSVAVVGASLAVLGPGKVVRDATIVVEDGVISGIGAGVKPPRGVERIDAGGKAVIPGLVNLHTHSTQVVIRGLLDRLPLAAWLRLSDSAYGILGRGDMEAAALAFLLDGALCGTTAFLDMERDVEAAASAAARLGVRLFEAYAMVDTVETGRSGLERLWSAEEEAARARRLASRRWPGRVKLLYGPVGYPSSSFELIEEAVEAAREEGRRVHMHLAETPVNARLARLRGYRGELEELEARGLLGPWLIAAHAVALDGYGVAALAKYGVSVAHCPSSNAKLGNGAAASWELARSGVNVGLGTDGAGSGDSASMLWEMRAASLIQRAVSGEAWRVSAREAFAMATINGGRALGERIGALRRGWAGDMVLLDLRDPSLWPPDRLVENLVFSASCRAVDTVIVGGDLIVRDGLPVREELLSEARRSLAEARRKVVEVLGGGEEW